MKFKLFLVVATLVLGGVMSAQQAQSAPADPPSQSATQDTKPAPADSTPSLADVAREKSAAKKSKHVFTNDDIPSHPEEAAADASQAKDAASTDADKSDDKSGDAADKDAKKPEEDSIQVKGAKKVVEAKSIQIDAVTDEMKKLEYDLANAKTPDEASSIAQSIRNLQHNIEVWKNVRDDAQKVVDDAKKPKPQPGQ